jgi:hypothetical protein
MRLATGAAVLMLTIGCTGSVAEDVHKSPVASAARDTDAPSPSPSDPPLSTISFACRLPVTKSTSGGDYVGYAGGFLSFPAATFQSDPTGGMHSRYMEGGFATDHPPVLYGSPQAGPPFYDAAQRRWVPASAAQSTADGAFYAYGTGINLIKEQPSVRVVDVAHATEKTFTPAIPGIETPAGFFVVDFDANGVYFMTWRGDSYGSGVWLLNPATGDVRVLTNTADVLKVRGGFAWVGRLDPRDPSPPGGVANRHLYNSIVRLDLKSGAEVIWYYNAGHSVWLKGLDSRDHPVVTVATAPDYPIDTSEIRLIDTAGALGTIVYDGGGHSGTWSPEALWFTEPQADGDRLWFGSARGLYLYTPAGGLQKVLALPAPLPGAEVTIAPAGFCR